MFIALRFSLQDVDRAYEEWGCNCGPGAVAAICGLTLDEVRAHLQDFEKKRYTNPTMMRAILNSLGVRWACKRLTADWPLYGLARVQWEGPWTEPGVPMAARYRKTHWVGANAEDRSNIGIFDINCMNSGGWVPLDCWASVIVPHILKGYPGANGRWHITHAVEVHIGSARSAHQPVRRTWRTLPRSSSKSS
jgi:hypothetical protein